MAVGQAAVLLTVAVGLFGAQTARAEDGSGPNAERKRAEQFEEKAENQHYRALFGKFQAQISDALRAAKNDDIAGLAEEFNRSIDGRLLYLRVVHIDGYAAVAGVDAPSKTTALVEQALQRLAGRHSEDSRCLWPEPRVTRKTQDGRVYLLIENGRLEGGRYDGDLSITMAISARKPEEWPQGPLAVKQVITMIELPWQEKVSDEKLDEAAASLKPVADEAVDEIMRAFNRSGQAFAYRHRAVQILQRLNSEKARATLLDIALGRSAEGLPSMKQWASAAYLRTTQDASDSRKLLVSDDSGVLGNALRALKGVEVDEALLERLLELTAYQGDKEPMFQESVRLLAAAVMAADPSGKSPARKVDAIVTAVERVASLPHASKIHWPGSYTYAESSYHQYTECLSEMRRGGRGPAQATPRATAVARDILVIARANAATPPSARTCTASLTTRRRGCGGPGRRKASP